MAVSRSELESSQSRGPYWQSVARTLRAVSRVDRNGSQSLGAREQSVARTAKALGLAALVASLVGRRLPFLLSRLDSFPVSAVERETSPLSVCAYLLSLVPLVCSSGC